MCALVTVVPTVGAFWMIYTAIRFEKNPLPFILLAIIPFACFWYYFDRARLKNMEQGLANEFAIGRSAPRHYADRLPQSKGIEATNCCG